MRELSTGGVKTGLDLLTDEDLEDGLHPNTAGHKKMFERMKKFLIDTEIV